MASHFASGLPVLGIGEGSVIEGAIIDKNVRVGKRTRIVNDHHFITTADSDRYMVRDSIVVVPKDAVIPDGWFPESGLAGVLKTD